VDRDRVSALPVGYKYNSSFAKISNLASGEFPCNFGFQENASHAIFSDKLIIIILSGFMGG